MSNSFETKRSARQDSPKAEPPTLEFKRLVASCNRGVFVCGDSDIDSWFRAKALRHHDDFRVRVVTAHLMGNPAPVGFYALMIRVEPEALLGGGWLSRGQGGYFSSVHLSTVAVQRNMQRQGIGSMMMACAINDFYEIVMKTGIFAMTVVALNREIARFYEKLGFAHYGDRNSPMPRMLLPAQSVVDLVEGRESPG